MLLLVKLTAKMAGVWPVAAAFKLKKEEALGEEDLSIIHRRSRPDTHHD